MPRDSSFRVDDAGNSRYPSRHPTKPVDSANIPAKCTRASQSRSVLLVLAAIDLQLQNLPDLAPPEDAHRQLPPPPQRRLLQPQLLVMMMMMTARNRAMRVVMMKASGISSQIWKKTSTECTWVMKTILMLQWRMAVILMMTLRGGELLTD